MAYTMAAPELFRTPLDLPAMPYDHLLRFAAERTPDSTAIIYADLRLTYRQVISMVNSLANGLHSIGLGRGDRICLFTPNRPEYPLMLNAAATIGAVITPMNPAYKEREIVYQLTNSEAKAILVYRDLVPLLQNILQANALPHLKHIIVSGTAAGEEMEGMLSFARLLREGSPTRPEPIEIDADELFVLPYSSGTTGLPKGVMLSHRNLVSNHLQFVTAAGINSSDTTLIFLPLYHIYGVLLTGSFLAAGATQVLLERFDPTRVLDLCERHNVTWFFAVPLAPARKLHERTGITIVQGYGLTESSPATHLSPLEPMRLDNVGLLVSNTEHKIMDIETGTRELTPGEDGEVVVRGPQIMQGYWKAPEETARVLRDGWLYTGDIGHLDTQGYLYIVDRKKEMIKYKAFSVAPAELEILLLEHPAVQDVAVIGVADDEAGEVPKGFVVLRPGQQATADDLMAFVNKRVAAYKQIRYIEFIDAIPKVPSGKILRRVLLELERSRKAQGST